MEAAEHALATDGVTDAMNWLELALRSQLDPRLAAGIRIRLCQVEWETNPAAAARHLTGSLADLLAGRLERRDGIDLARRLLWHGRSTDAAAALDLIRGGEPAGGPGLAAELRDLDLWLAYNHPALARRRPAPRASPHLSLCRW